jgi:hypothetical protein
MEVAGHAEPQEKQRMENLVRLAVWPAALTLAVATATLILTSDVADPPSLTAALTLVVGLSWSVIGLVQWPRLEVEASRSHAPG